MEGAGRFISSLAGALWFGNIAGRGGGTGLVKVASPFSKRHNGREPPPFC